MGEGLRFGILTPIYMNSTYISLISKIISQLSSASSGIPHYLSINLHLYRYIVYLDIINAKWIIEHLSVCARHELMMRYYLFILCHTTVLCMVRAFGRFMDMVRAFGRFMVYPGAGREGGA